MKLLKKLVKKLFLPTMFFVARMQGSVMNDTVFREYDIRGKVGSELVVDQVYAVAQAIAFYFVQQQPNVKTVVVGMDGRTHSPAIKNQVCKAFIDSGLDVQFIGVCPSPVVYFALHTMPVDAGIVITASHNTKEYNGIKINLNKNDLSLMNLVIFK